MAGRARHTSDDGYSARRAAHGSIRVARRAGSHAAISPTAISSSVCWRHLYQLVA
jgi:hypothetical protein